MLIDFLFGFLLKALNWMVGFFPTWSWSRDAGEWLWTLSAGANNVIGQWFPVHTIFSIVLTWLGLEVAYAGVVAVVWTYNRIRGA